MASPAPVDHRGTMTALSVVCLLCSACAVEVFPEVRYLAVGDSITGGGGAATYAVEVVRQLDIPPGEFAVQGAGGRSAAEGLQTLRHIADLDVYPNLETFIYFLGGADIIDFIRSRDPGLAIAPGAEAYPFTAELDVLLEDLSSTYSESLDIARAEGWTVYVATYYDLPAGVVPCDAFGDVLSEVEAGRAAEYVALLNGVIEASAASAGAVLVDLTRDNAALMSSVDHYADCVHLSEAGSRIIAERFLEALEGSAGP